MQTSQPWCAKASGRQPGPNRTKPWEPPPCPPAGVFGFHEASLLCLCSESKATSGFLPLFINNYTWHKPLGGSRGSQSQGTGWHHALPLDVRQAVWDSPGGMSGSSSPSSFHGKRSPVCFPHPCPCRGWAARLCFTRGRRQGRRQGRWTTRTRRRALHHHHQESKAQSPDGKHWRQVVQQVGCRPGTGALFA